MGGPLGADLYRAEKQRPQGRGAGPEAVGVTGATMGQETSRDRSIGAPGGAAGHLLGRRAPGALASRSEVRREKGRAPSETNLQVHAPMNTRSIFVQTTCRKIAVTYRLQTLRECNPDTFTLPFSSHVCTCCGVLFEKMTAEPPSSASGYSGKVPVKCLRRKRDELNRNNGRPLCDSPPSRLCLRSSH